MIRVLIIADVANHAFAHRAAGLIKHCPPDIQIEVEYYDERNVTTIAWSTYDVVFALPTGLGLIVRRLWRHMQIRMPPLIISHNSGLGRRTETYLEAILCADLVICNNYVTWANMFPYVLPNRYNAVNISNGVDLDVFSVTRPIEERPHKVVWCSTASKLEDRENDVKGYEDVLRPLKILLENRPEPWEVDYRIIEAGAGYSQEQMAEWYNGASYCVIGSKSEGTPNIALEAAACGCVVVSSAVGNMPELIQNGVNGIVVGQRDLRNFWQGMQVAREYREHLSQHMQEDIKTWDWSHRADWFYAVFRAAAAGRCRWPWTYLDTTPEQICPTMLAESATVG